MDWTDIHYRQLARLISRHTWLYTEMVVDMTILHSPHTDKYDPSLHNCLDWLLLFCRILLCHGKETAAVWSAGTMTVVTGCGPYGVCA